MWWMLLGCGEGLPTPLVDETRELGRITLADRSWGGRAALRGWHHGWSTDPFDPHPSYDAVYVGWELVPEKLLVRGDVEQTWDLGSVDEGRTRYDALRLASCVADDRAAFRMAPDGPWRILVPDNAGAAAGLAEGATCEEALAWAGPAADWRRDRTAHPALCSHLYRLGAKGDAIRCLLREPARSGTGHASRQDLPRAPDDPAFDAELLAVLAPGAGGDRSTFAPYRVRDLIREIQDRDPIEQLARTTIPEAPWEAVWVGIAVGTDPVAHEALLRAVDGWLDTPGPASDASAELILGPLGQIAAEDRVRPRMLRAADRPPIETCPPQHRPVPDRCADLGTLARGWLEGHPAR